MKSPVPNPKSEARKPESSAFTLVEMLTVLVIIGILAGLGLTAMQHIGRATALQTAARQFAGHVNMARNYAVANSTYLYLVVATHQTTNSPEFAYRSYGFCIPVSGVTTQAVNSKAYVRYVDDIFFLPKGVVFGTNLVSGLDSNSSISFPEDGSNTTTAWTVTFTPSGQILPMSRRPQFELFEGVIDPSSVRPRRTAASTNSYIVEINPLIGKPIVSRYP